MKNPVKSTREEINQKLILLYSDSLDSNRNILDFEKKYDFFSTDESVVLKFSSNWFYPDKYSLQSVSPQSLKHYQSPGQDDGGYQRLSGLLNKQESLLKIEKFITTNNLTRDLEVLGKTPYQIGVDGEKFRVVAATLQKCTSPFIRRTFHFTSNGIVEASEKKGEVEHTIPMLKPIKAAVQPSKFVRIRRFRVIKKNDLPVEKYILPQRIQLTNGEKTRFLTVKIRPKNSNAISGEKIVPGRKVEAAQNEVQQIVKGVEGKESEIFEKNWNSAVQTEEVEEVDQSYANTSEQDTSSASLDPIEEELEEKMEEVRQMRQKEQEKEKIESGDSYKCENCGKQFLTYLSCLAHVRSHQRQVCQFCSKRFLTVKMLRDHIKLQHQHDITKPRSSEDRITTATSKFGRTRQVLNVAGLRSKYKML